MKINNPTFYLYVRHVGGRAEAARRLEISPAMVGHIITGIRGVSPAVAMKVEADSKGLVSRSQLRPDLWGESQVAA